MVVRDSFLFEGQGCSEPVGPPVVAFPLVQSWWRASFPLVLRYRLAVVSPSGPVDRGFFLIFCEELNWQQNIL